MDRSNVARSPIQQIQANRWSAKRADYGDVYPNILEYPDNKVKWYHFEELLEKGWSQYNPNHRLNLAQLVVQKGSTMVHVMT